MRFEHHAVGRHAVAFGEDQDVVAHHLAAGDAQGRAVADDQRARAGEIAQRRERVFGAPLLNDGDAHDDADEAEQDQRFVHITHEQVDGTGADQQQEHRLAADLANDVQQRAPLVDAEFVETFRTLPLGDRGRVEAARNVGVHLAASTSAGGKPAAPGWRSCRRLATSSAGSTCVIT